MKSFMKRSFSLWLRLFVILSILPYASTDWPMTNSSGVQLLGLFYDLSDNTSSSAWSIQARAMFQSAVLLSQRYNITIQGQLITWQSVQTEGDSMTALATTCQRIMNFTIMGIVGPPYSRESAVLAPFSQRVGIPVVSYAATDPTLSDSSTYPAFYRTVPADTTAALAIAQLFLQFNWASVIVIYQNDAYGTGGATAIADTFIHLNLTIAQSIIFDIASLSIQGDLKSLLMNSRTRIVVLWMESSHARLVLEDAIRFDILAPHFTWIFSANVPLDNFNTTDARQKLAGMFTVEPAVGSVVGGLINSTLLNEAYEIWNRYEPDSFPGVDNVNSYALFAFDATWILIQGLSQLCSLNLSNSSCTSFSGDSFCFDRRFVDSDLLIDILNHNSFRGVTGPIQFSKNTTNRIDGNYYIARNIHGYSTGLEYVPGLVWSNSGGWTRNAHTNVIIWPGTSLVVPTGYIEISRLTLQVAVIEAPPFTIRREFSNGSGATYTKLTGYIPEFIEQLQDSMGFAVNITLFTSDQSYNDLIDAVANGTFDLLIGDVTITSSRREKVGFSTSIFDNSLRVIIRETPDSELDLWSFLEPFSTTLWVVSFAAIAYAGLLFALIERDSNEMLQNRSVRSLIAMSLWFSFGTITGYGVDFCATTAAGRVLTIGLYVLSLVLVATYTAHLTSDLTVKKAADFISGIDDIKSGKVEPNRIGILVDTSIEDYYLREISAGNRNFYPLQSLDEMFDALVNNLIDASIMDAGILEYATSSTYCNLTLVGKDFDQSAFGIVFQKNWLFNQNLDVAVLTIKESGITDNLKIKWFQSSACSYTEETSVAMSVESMAGLFMTFAMITTIGILWFVWKKRSTIKKQLLTRFRGENLQLEQNHSAEATSNKTLPDDSSTKSPACMITYL